MISEWLKVMLDEIARKKAEAEQARIEAARHRDEPSRGDGPAGGDGAAGGDGQPRGHAPSRDDEVRAPNTDAVADPAPGAARRAR